MTSAYAGQARFGATSGFVQWSGPVSRSSLSDFATRSLTPACHLDRPVLRNRTPPILPEGAGAGDTTNFHIDDEDMERFHESDFEEDEEVGESDLDEVWRPCTTSPPAL